MAILLLLCAFQQRQIAEKDVKGVLLESLGFGILRVGGGVSGAWPLFLPSLVAELNSDYTGPNGGKFRRLAPVAFNLEDPAQLEKFLKGEAREITVPGSVRKLKYNPLPRLGVGVSRLGTSEAVAIGAYAFALQKLS